MTLANIHFVLVLVSGLATLVVLFVGILSMGCEATAGASRSNRLMAWRVRLQLITVLLILCGIAPAAPDAGPRDADNEKDAREGVFIVGFRRGGLSMTEEQGPDLPRSGLISQIGKAIRGCGRCSRRHEQVYAVSRGPIPGAGYFGIRTVSITWMTPLSAATSAVTTLAPLTVTPPIVASTMTISPSTVLASVFFPARAELITFPGTT